MAKSRSKHLMHHVVLGMVNILLVIISSNSALSKTEAGNPYDVIYSYYCDSASSICLITQNGVRMTPTGIDGFNISLGKCFDVNYKLFRPTGEFFSSNNLLCDSMVKSGPGNQDPCTFRTCLGCSRYAKLVISPTYINHDNTKAVITQFYDKDDRLWQVTFYYTGNTLSFKKIAVILDN